MDKLSPPVTVSVIFKAADGSVVPAPAGVTFSSSSPGVDSFAFNSTLVNPDGSYNLVVTPGTSGTDSITASGLAGVLSVTVTDPAAVSVEFSPASL